MNELTSAKSANLAAINVTASPTNTHATFFAGRTRLRSVFLMDTSVGADAGDSYVVFRNKDRFGDVLLKVFPNITNVVFGVWNSQGLFFELPGNGILFDGGLHATLTIAGGGTTRGLRVTVLYG